MKLAVPMLLLAGLFVTPSAQENPPGTHLSAPVIGLEVALAAPPKCGRPTPSPTDVAAAIKTKKTFYVTGAQGLYAVSPQGQVMQVFQSPSWATDKNPK
ncbi:MAG: hypothetical protein ABSG16_23245 [Candidatus Acidiferrum sp.]|jgi:hypothetical protein